MRRYAGLILLFIAIGANSQDDAVAPADNNTVISETGMCEGCVCTKAKVDCMHQYLDPYISFEEWRSLTDIKPTRVDLSNNEITFVDVIAELPIQELNLSYNMIEDIDNAAFRDLAQLRVLDLSFNKLSSKLSPRAFEGHYHAEEYEPLLNLRVLNLAYNDFHSLNQDLFEHLPDLTSLDLTGNPLTTIDQVTLFALSSLAILQELRLRECQLSEIPDTILQTPRFLERLDLSSNLLTSVPKALVDSKNLVYLNLDQNPIKVLDMEAEEVKGFPRLPKLKELHMCNMPELTRIGQGALGGLEQLSILHLSFNPKLTDIHPRALAKLDDYGEVYDWPIIKELYLQSNNLSKIDRELVARWDLVEKMDISGNPFLCDCSTLRMMDDFFTVVERTRVNGSETLVCQEPWEIRGWNMQHLHDTHLNMHCEDVVVNQPKEDEVVNQPEVDEVMDQSEEDEVVNQPEVDEVVNQPEEDEVVNQSEEDEVVNQPEVDRVVVPGSYIDAVAPADNNTVIKLIKETEICEVCVCTNAKVNCMDKNLDSFFSYKQWHNLGYPFAPTKVDLSHNNLTTVTVMAELPIQELNLSNNLIGDDDIEEAAFSALADLRVLDLSSNKLFGYVSPRGFKGYYVEGKHEPLLSMRVLNLSYNDFTFFNPNFFEHLPELTSLDLSGNPLTAIHDETMIAISNLPMLQELRLRECQISEISDKFLHTSRFLERLDLSSNLLTSVPQVLVGSKNLVYLNLNQNPIKQLDMEAAEVKGFPRLPKLKELHMCNMPELTRIGQGALGGLEQLSILHLSFNPKLTDFHPKALAKLDDYGEVYDWPIIKELYLQSNNLSKIDRELIARWDLVEKMDISGNPFLCDCSTLWMMDDFFTVVERTRVNGSETLVCQEPLRMRGWSMQYLHDTPLDMHCEDVVTDQPEEDEVVNQPKEEEVVNQPEVDEVVNQPEEDEVMDQPEVDRVVVPGSYIGVLPWLFLAGPTLLALMIFWRRKSSRNYDKLALVEENYI